MLTRHIGFTSSVVLLLPIACGGPEKSGEDAPDSCHAPCTVLASGLTQAYRIVVNASDVYWTSGADEPLVMKVSTRGGTPAEFASEQDSPMGIVLDSTSVYWTNRGGGGGGGAVMKASLDGGARMTLAFWPKADGPDAVTVDSANVYWVDAGDTGSSKLMMVPITGGNPTRLADSGSNSWGGGIAVDSTTIYWTDSGGGIMKMPMAGGTPTVLASGQARPHGMAIDETNAYWVNEGVNEKDGTVMKAPLSGDAGPTVLASDQLDPRNIVVDGTNAYWTNAGTYGPPDAMGASSPERNGSVMKVPLGGGPTTTLASNLFRPEGIAIDDASVYWTTAFPYFQSAVMKTPK